MIPTDFIFLFIVRVVFFLWSELIRVQFYFIFIFLFDPSWSESIRVDPTQTGGPSWSGPTFVPACFVMFYFPVSLLFFFGGGGVGVDTFSLKLPSIRYQKIKIPIFEDFFKNENLTKICFKMIFYKDHHRMITPNSNIFQRQYNIDPMPQLVLTPRKQNK